MLLQDAVRVTNAHPAGTYQIILNAGFGVSETFALTVGNTLCSQGQFLPATSLDVGANPTTTEVADFNNDGYQDFAVALNATRAVSIQLGNGSGGFTTSSTLIFGESTTYLTINDFNGDGNADIVVKGASNLYVRLGDGLGGFTSGATIYFSSSISILSEDLDQDSKLDIVVTGQAGFAVFKGNGQGGFSLLNTYNNGILLNFIEKGDFNGDGFTDLSMGSPTNGNNYIYLGDGIGGFDAGTSYNLSTAIRFSTIGDFDGDGKSDIISALGNTPGTVAFQKNNGDGSFDIPTYIEVGGNPFQAVSGDFNGDGKLDFATGNTASSSVSVRYGNGDGTFYGTTELLTNAPAPASALRLIVGDFNNDGVQDIGSAYNTSTTDDFSIFLGASKEINVLGNAVDIVSGDSSPDTADDTDFGTVVLNTPSTKTYTIQNTGTSNLSVSSIALSGADAASFIVGDITLPATIAAGASTTFTVTFNAATSGVKTATVTITSDDCDESAYTFSVRGKDDSYTVSFDANGGTGTMAGQAIANNASANLTSNSFNRTGYTFAGWNTAADGTGTSYADGASYPISNAADVTLFAQWTPNNYTVTFDVNGGTGTMSDQTIAYLASANLTANSLTRTGYSFTGWNTAADGSGTSYTDGASYTISVAADVTLFAAWTANNYTVTFDPNDGIGTMTNQSIAFNAAANLTVNSFTRTGYSFTGWNTAADGSGTSYTDGASYTISVAADVTLFAQWTPNNYTITFDANGSFGEMSDQTIAYDASENLRANAFNLTGYRFMGWATTPGGAVGYADGASYTMTACTSRCLPVRTSGASRGFGRTDSNLYQTK